MGQVLGMGSQGDMVTHYHYNLQYRCSQPLYPGMKDIYTFNLISLFAFSSVLMTYFGVNYYLSGMHSYASGDPVPVPSFVYVAVILLTTLSVLAYFKYSGYTRSVDIKSKD